MKQIVVSREFKAMLKAERFSGDQTQLLTEARKFWRSFRGAISGIGLVSRGNLDDPQQPMLVKFYDTADRGLYRNDYICRERIDARAGKRKVTLKFRHPDRYVCADRNMSAAAARNAETKLEEDIKLPFVTFYSLSTTQGLPRDKTLNRLRDLGRSYPGLAKELKPFPKGANLRVVRNFVAEEIVVTGAAFQLRKNPRTDAECALIAWYDNKGERKKPVVVEFSFRYGNKRGEYGRKSAQKAYDAFRILGQALAQWVDTQGPTKTAFVYR
jgi:hypothetical protein